MSHFSTPENAEKRGNTALDCPELLQNDRCGLNFLAGLVASQLVTALWPVGATALFFLCFLLSWNADADAAAAAAAWVPLSAAVLALERAF